MKERGHDPRGLEIVRGGTQYYGPIKEQETKLSGSTTAIEKEHEQRYRMLIEEYFRLFDEAVRKGSR